MVTAVVRTLSLEPIAGALDRAGLRGMTISKIRGVGEQVTLNTPYSEHDKIEIIVPDGKADEVVRIILEHASTGLAGDGVIAVRELDYAVRIRTREKLA